MTIILSCWNELGGALSLWIGPRDDEGEWAWEVASDFHRNGRRRATAPSLICGIGGRDTGHGTTRGQLPLPCWLDTDAIHMHVCPRGMDILEGLRPMTDIEIIIHIIKLLVAQLPPESETHKQCMIFLKMLEEK
jgi:hypothetical protein